MARGTSASHEPVVHPSSISLDSIPGPAIPGLPKPSRARRSGILPGSPLQIPGYQVRRKKTTRCEPMSPLPEAVRSPDPPYRRLRAFAFDPSLSRQIDTSEINEVILKVPWDRKLGPGPVDSYLEIVDHDPASRAFYTPIDLNDPRLLAQDGLAPSEGNPQFHQQMAYGVARTTIHHFELALGRRALWSAHKRPEDGKDDPTLRLRVYPHAIREANAYYSPEKKALIFGYFPASPTEHGMNMPGETVFTCLSHDIVAHETTHALVDGLHPYFLEPSNMDIWALHEALADIVALFQHFTYPEVLKHQIARTAGDLEKQNILGELAFQFGQAIGNYGALRNAIGGFDEKTGKWIVKYPDPEEILHTTEPHGRGAILVAAVFDAFLSIYKSRIKDLLRIASRGSGTLPPGEIHPDLVNRLSGEAAKTARHLLQICIRALDYCPPVDIDFGDYLRALITADVELVTDDRHNYRLAVIEAFRRRGIYPGGIRTLSVESLIWHVPDEGEQELFQKAFSGDRDVRKLVPEWGTGTEPGKIHNQACDACRILHKWLYEVMDSGLASVTHLVWEKKKDSLYREEDGTPLLEVHSIRPANRIGPDGKTIAEIVIEITQCRRGYMDKNRQMQVDNGEINPPEPDFIQRGGCTLLIDSGSGNVRYCIYKDVMSPNRLVRTRELLKGAMAPSLHTMYYGDPYQNYFREVVRTRGKEAVHFEPFALLHRSPLSGGVP